LNILIIAANAVTSSPNAVAGGLDLPTVADAQSWMAEKVVAVSCVPRQPSLPTIACSVENDHHSRELVQFKRVNGRWRPVRAIGQRTF
jgi:hypothetical protein